MISFSFILKTLLPSKIVRPQLTAIQSQNIGFYIFSWKTALGLEASKWSYDQLKAFNTAFEKSVKQTLSLTNNTLVAVKNSVINTEDGSVTLTYAIVTQGMNEATVESRVTNDDNRVLLTYYFENYQMSSGAKPYPYAKMGPATVINPVVVVSTEMVRQLYYYY